MVEGEGGNGEGREVEGMAVGSGEHRKKRCKGRSSSKIGVDGLISAQLTCQMSRFCYVAMEHWRSSQRSYKATVSGKKMRRW